MARKIFSKQKISPKSSETPSETTSPPTLLTSNTSAVSITSTSRTSITSSKNSTSTPSREWERPSSNLRMISRLTNSKKSTEFSSTNSSEKIHGHGSSPTREYLTVEDSAISVSTFLEVSHVLPPSSLGKIEIPSSQVFRSLFLTLIIRYSILF